METDKMTFEEALAGLEKSASDLNRHNSTLEEAIKCYEKGLDYYAKCNDILNDAKQKIEYYKNEEIQ